MNSFYGRKSALLASLAALAVVILGIVLGSWQLQRAAEKASQQQAQDRAAASPPLDLGRSPATGGDEKPAPLPPPASIDGRSVQATGTFIPARSIFLDNRTRDGVAGFHVMTPLKLDGRDEHVMVLRGWVARDPVDRNRLPAVNTPAEPVRIVGQAVADLKQPMMLGEEPVPGPGDRLWQHFEYGKMSAWAGFRLYPVILRQTAEPDYRDGLARDWNQPGVSVDRHRAYAFQWFALTVTAIVAWLVLIRQRRAAHDIDQGQPLARR